MERIDHIVNHFAVGGRPTGTERFGNGNVNDTFLVRAMEGVEKRLILQRINGEVFPEPALVMENLRRFVDHASARLPALADGKRRPWQIPGLVQTKTGEDFFLDQGGAYWRLFAFIDKTRSLDTIETPSQAAEAGFALARFHRLVHDLPPELLADTLPGFHVTPLYIDHYDRVRARPGMKDSVDIRFCHDFIARRRSCARVLEDAREKGDVVLRPIHGDPKLNNILFDEESDLAVSIIDLDTVKPGLIQHDIGDCLRSCCNPAGERGLLDRVRFDPDLCRIILRAYLQEAGVFLTDSDYRLLPAAIWLLPFELGLRFFTDHLEGDLYFRTREPGLNLQRALVQFALVESIEGQQGELERIIKEIRSVGPKKLKR